MRRASSPPRSARPMIAAFDPERIVRALAKRRVRYVLLGATAARLQGFPRLTAKCDITPAADPANLKRLSIALRDLNARIYTESAPEGLPFSYDAQTLSRASSILGQMTLLLGIAYVFVTHLQR